MKPAEELRAAAAKLREMSVKASPGPWSAGTAADGTFYHQYGEFGFYVTGPAGSPELDDSQQAKDDASWIALMGPDKAEQLVEFLDEAAHLVRFADVMAGSQEAENHLSVLERTALKLARSILGESR